MEIDILELNAFAADVNNSIEDVKSRWWQVKDHRMNSWRKELRALASEHNMTPVMLCEYLGAAVSERPSFWTKMPMKRDVFIGIGMAFKQPLSVINRWITEYGGKKKLYVKDILGDMVWIYLIQANEKDQESGFNYFKDYERCRQRMEESYLKLWHADEHVFIDTREVSDDFERVIFDADYLQLERFVESHLMAFHSAYAKPRRLLDGYVRAILDELRKSGSRECSLNSLRGYLDDSMINYLSGDVDTINVIDRKTKELSAGRKKVPLSKSSHIQMCLALGMTLDEMNGYLKLMGYELLDPTDRKECQMMNILSRWEKEHPLQRRFKEDYIFGGFFGGSLDGDDCEENNSLSMEEKAMAIDEMLSLRETVNVLMEEQ